MSRWWLQNVSFFVYVTGRICAFEYQWFTHVDCGVFLKWTCSFYFPASRLRCTGSHFLFIVVQDSSGIVELQITLTFIVHYYHNQNPCLLLGSCLVVRNYDILLRFRRLCKMYFSHLELVLLKHYELPLWLAYQTQGNIIISTVNKIRLELYLGVFN